MRRSFVGVAMLVLGCGAHNDANYAAAAFAIMEAASVATLNVASGACVTACAYGTYCDEHGMCKAFPCHDSCRSNEECVSQPVEHCVPIQAERLEVDVFEASDSPSGNGHTLARVPARVEPPSPPPQPLLPDSREQR